MPPLSEVVDVLLKAVLPALLTAAALLALVERLGSPKLAPVGAALGLAGGAALGNWLCGTLTLEEASNSSWNRLPWAALAALLVGLVARLFSPAVGWPLRGAVAVVAASWVLPGDLRKEVWWLPPALAAVMLVEWALLEHLASRPPGADVPLALALTAFAAAAVLIYAPSKRLM